MVRIKEEEDYIRAEAEKIERGFGDDDEDEDEDEGGRDCERCIEEAEKVMMELYEKGELGFGSFGGRGRQGEVESCCSVPAINASTVSLNQIEDEEGGGDHFVKYKIIQMAGSFPNT